MYFGKKVLGIDGVEIEHYVHNDERCLRKQRVWHSIKTTPFQMLRMGMEQSVFEPLFQLATGKNISPVEVRMNSVKYQ